MGVLIPLGGRRRYSLHCRSSAQRRDGRSLKGAPMGKHSAVPQHKYRLTGGLMLGAAASGAMAVGSLSSAGVASASCASISGVGAGNGCTSSPTSFAIGIGNNAGANAQGLFNGAVANGDNSFAESIGAFNFAYAGGNNSYARSEGNLNAAVVQGNNSIAQAGGSPSDTGNLAVNFGNGTNLGDSYTVATGNFNAAANVGDNNFVGAQGLGSTAFNMVGNRNYVFSYGMFNNATNIAGDDNNVQSINFPDLSNPFQPSNIGGNVAFNTFGNKNNVIAGVGPFAVAGAIGQNNATDTQQTTGIQITR